MSSSRQSSQIVLAGLAAVVAISLGAALLDTVGKVLDRPEVWVSHSTGECTDVKDYAAEHRGEESPWSCDNLPKSYSRVWVE